VVVAVVVLLSRNREEEEEDEVDEELVDGSDIFWCFEMMDWFEPSNYFHRSDI